MSELRGTLLPTLQQAQEATMDRILQSAFDEMPELRNQFAFSRCSESRVVAWDAVGAEYRALEQYRSDRALLSTPRE